MVHSSCYHQGEVRHWVGVLKELEVQITERRTALEEHAEEAKHQIKLVTSKYVDTLKTREGWLLHHVEDVLRLKDESLALQASVLGEVLLQMEEFSKLEEKDFDDEDVRGQVQAVIGKVSQLAITPSEDDCLRFEVDPSSLEDVIINLGSIVSKNDDELFADDVLECDEQPQSVPRSSYIMEESSETVSETDTAGWLVCPSGMEVDESCQSSVATTFSEEAELKPFSEVVDYFQEVQYSPVHQWIRNVVVNGDSDAVDKEVAIENVLAPFCQSQDPVTWLRSNDFKEVNSKMEAGNTTGMSSLVGPIRDDLGKWLYCPEKPRISSDVHLQQFKELAACPLNEWTCCGRRQKNTSVRRSSKASNDLGSNWLISKSDTCELDLSDGIAAMSFGSDASRESTLFVRATRDSKENLACVGKCEKPNWLENFHQIRDTNKHWLLSRPEDSIVKPGLCMWLARFSKQRCNDCPGSCSYDMFRSINTVPSTFEQKQWLLKGSDW